MKIRKLHKWNLTYKEAVQLQRQLASRVQFSAIKKNPKIIAGLDCAFSKDGKKIFTAVVVINISDFSIIETITTTQKLNFPYIPGLLSFREAPACIEAIKKLKTRPDLFIIDGQGFAHPRRLGIASHIGLFIDKPVIGCAKSRLTGTFETPARKRGSFSPLIDVARPSWPCPHGLETRATEQIGAVLRTRTDIKPVFVSVGNRCTLDDAIKIVLECTTKYRLPEPSRLAHQLVSQFKKINAAG